MNDLTARIDEQLKATEGHTPGPWTAGGVPSWKYEHCCLEDQRNIYPPLGEAGPVAEVSGPENQALITAAPTLRSLLVEARAQLAAQAEALAAAEWGGTQQGAPYGSMWHNTPGPLIPACPICKGVHPEKGKREFNAEALGHRPTCPFALLGAQS